MRRNVVGFALVVAWSWSVAAKGEATVFSTESTADQTVTSPLFGGAVSLSARGEQVFTIDPAARSAGVTSDFVGNDLPDPLHPGGFLSYQLYNTKTLGTVTENESRTYQVNFEILFELKITSGPLAGLTFETLQYATFTASDVAAIPFPPGTAFSDPTPPDPVWVFVKLGRLIKLPVGTSSQRVVTIDAIVP